MDRGGPLRVRAHRRRLLASTHHHQRPHRRIATVESRLRPGQRSSGQWLAQLKNDVRGLIMLRRLLILLVAAIVYSADRGPSRNWRRIRFVADSPSTPFPILRRCRSRSILKAPGMTPEEVEARVVTPLEMELLGIPGKTISEVVVKIRHRRSHHRLRRGHGYLLGAPAGGGALAVREYPSPSANPRRATFPGRTLSASKTVPGLQRRPGYRAPDQERRAARL